MFSKLKNLKTQPNKTITFEDLIESVKNNKQKDLINKIRSLEYKSLEYNKEKLNVNCITPHGVFTSLRKDSLVKLSGYLYYDIDGIEPSETINKLIDTNFVCFICKSVGGNGISFLIKPTDTFLNSSETLTTENFSCVYGWVKDLLISKGFNIDNSAGGLVRKMIISSDDQVYTSNNTLKLNISKIHNQCIKKLEEKESGSTRATEPFMLKLVDITHIITETPPKEGFKEDYIIEESDYYKIMTSKKIYDGTKHTTYIRIMNALYYLNPNITKDEVFTYIYNINKESQNKMDYKYLNTFTYNTCCNIEKNGVRIKPRKKLIHFNMKKEYTTKEKQAFAAKIAGKVKKNKSISKINEAREYFMYEENIGPTQKMVAERSGLSISTVKRYWKCYDNEPMTKLEIETETTKELEQEQERENKLNELLEIEEDEFWDNWEPEKRIIKDTIVDKDYGDGKEIKGIIEKG